MESSMTNVFVVVKQEWGGAVVEGVFNTFEKANNWIDTQPNEEEKFNCFIQVQEVK